MIADANLVSAAINPDGSQHVRARRFLARHDATVPGPVVLEILLGSRLRGHPLVPVLGAVQAHFHVLDAHTFFTAAEAVDAGLASGVFDAVHLASAFHRGVPLVTNDQRLHGTGWPTRPF